MPSVKDLTRTYGERTVLDRVSFDVAPGRVTGFVGADGAGKTTTRRIIVGVLAATAGTVRWDGAEIDVGRRRSIGYLPEERGLYPKMSSLGPAGVLRPAARDDVDGRGRAGPQAARSARSRRAPRRAVGEPVARQPAARAGRRRVGAPADGPGARRAVQRPGPGRRRLDGRPAPRRGPKRRPAAVLQPPARAGGSDCATTW